MIFVTTGSYGFTGLIELIDSLVYRGLITETVIAQISGSEYIPKHIEYFKYASNISDYMEKSDLVITHGGIGTLLELSLLNKRFFAVANRDLADDHQYQILKKLSMDIGLIFCDKLDDSQLLSAIKLCKASDPVDVNLFTSNFIKTLRSDILSCSW